jgi:predicted aconitase
MDHVRDAYRDLTTATNTALNMVVLGSPHFSISEFKALAPLLKGRTRNDDVTFLVTCSRAVRLIAGELGLLEPLEAFGGRITVDTCPLASPMLPEHINSIMTNSAKYAYYTPGLLNSAVAFGTLEDCVDSAVSGRIQRDESIWGL